MVHTTIEEDIGNRGKAWKIIYTELRDKGMGIPSQMRLSRDLWDHRWQQGILEVQMAAQIIPPSMGEMGGVRT